MARTKLRGIPYYGGKSPFNKIGPWIASIFGFDKSLTYVEPFAGMLGVLLCRPAAKIEIVNDTNNDLINWWRCVRDRCDEFSRLVALTPRSRIIFSKACSDLRNDTYKDDPLRKALTFHVVCQQSMYHGVAAAPAHWGLAYTPAVATLSRWTGEEFAPLAKRLYHTQIENRDACTLLARVAEEQNSVVYCDPPYDAVTTTPYGENDVDRKQLAVVLRKQKGRVAISGYGEEWNHLKWYRSEKDTVFRAIGGTRRGGESRTEVLWTNFKPQSRGLLGSLR